MAAASNRPVPRLTLCERLQLRCFQKGTKGGMEDLERAIWASLRLLLCPS